MGQARISCELSHLPHKSSDTKISKNVEGVHHHQHGDEHQSSHEKKHQHTHSGHEDTSCCDSLDELGLQSSASVLEIFKVPSFATDSIILPKIGNQISGNKILEIVVLATSPPKPYFPTETIILII
jgi:hypothetical protein